MKQRILFPLLLALLLPLLSACGGGGTPAADHSPEDLAAAIQGARDAEENQVFPILTTFEDEYIFSLLSLSEADVSACAVSVSPMNVRAYGIALVVPAEGKADTVLAGLQGFIDLQQQNFEHYLPDQYDIAKNAVLETFPNGTILLAMCQDSGSLAANIRAALQ
ncbi:MAG: DUF4358 domain-containing protein [Ruminiclostridium sp.]|nr:DUF4358 domain-containing protein [Ruminiclostridium sp.]